MNLEENYIDLDDSILFDTYAFFEILKGNPNYFKYSSYRIITTKLNLFELYLGLLREVDEAKAGLEFEKYYKFIIDFDEEVIVNASKLKVQINKRNVSMTDCIGYCLAKQLGIKFLTGDKEFEGMDNVEFVK